MPHPPDPLLTLDDLHFAYRADSPILAGISLQIFPGELVALLGPNGAGKSTLLKAVVGPDALGAPLPPHRVRLSGGAQPLGRARARLVAFLPQHLPHTTSLDVEALVRLGRFPHEGPLGGGDPEGDAIVERALADCGLLTMRRRPTSELSGGERQRAFLAALLAQQAPLVLLDEPTAALDLHRALMLADLLADLVADKRRAVLMATHDVNLAAARCSRLVVLRRGQIVADGTPAEVLTPALLREVFEIEATLLTAPDGALIVHPTAPRRSPP